MNKHIWLDLQLFAEGEGGGEGATTGVEAVDPGQQRLLELGVPADKIRKRASEAVAKMTKAPARQEPAQEQKPTEQIPTAEPTEEEPKADAPTRMSWDDIMKDPEYNKKMQAVVQSRLRSAKGAEESLQKMAPAIEVLARKYGLDPANPDYEALSKKINDDESYYEDKAMEMGVSIDEARKLDQKERDTARQQRQEAINLEQKKFQDHIMNLERQAEEMKKVFPKFDLRTELRNPIFARMTSPSGGVSVEDAYYAIHRKELQTATAQASAQATAKQISNAIQAGSRRPQENGTSGQAPSVTHFDYSKASPEQRKQFKAFLESERAAGRKVYPGSFKG
jgi:hypothetical protein